MTDQTEALLERVGAVAPTLAVLTRDSLVTELWGRPGLSPRERSLVTLATLIARDTPIAYPHYFAKALDTGVTPGEISELVTHLAFYGGWPHAFGAVSALRDLFAARGIAADALPETDPVRLPIETTLPDEPTRLAFISANVAPVSHALAHFTTDLLYHRIWLRPGLAPRDRSLVSLAALAASGQAAFLPFYLNRAVLLGVTEVEIGEMLAHTAFYGGWANAIAAASAVKGFFETPPA